MNFWKAVLTCFCVLTLASCGVQKRLYRHGFYVPHASSRISPKPDSACAQHYSAGKTVPVQLSSENIQITAEANPKLPSVQIPAKGFSHKQDKSLQTTQGIIPGQIKEQHIPKKSRGSLDTEDLLYIIGLSAIVIGIALILLGAAMNPANPGMGSGIIILGLIICLLGLVLIGINNPSIFADLLIGLIDAMT